MDAKVRVNITMFYWDTIVAIFEDSISLMQLGQFRTIPILIRSGLEAIAICDILVNAFEEATQLGEYKDLDELIRCLLIKDIIQHIKIYKDIELQKKIEDDKEKYEFYQKALKNEKEKIEYLIKIGFGINKSLNLELNKNQLIKKVEEWVDVSTYKKLKYQTGIIKELFKSTKVFEMEGLRFIWGVDIYEELCLSSHANISDYLIRGLEGDGRKMEIEQSIKLIELFKNNLGNRIMAIGKEVGYFFKGDDNISQGEEMLNTFDNYKELKSSELGIVGNINHSDLKLAFKEGLQDKTFYEALRSFNMILCNEGYILPGKGQKGSRQDLEVARERFEKLLSELNNNKDLAFKLMNSYYIWALNGGVGITCKEREDEVLKKVVFKYPPTI